jgi:hypothetical protein
MKRLTGLALAAGLWLGASGIAAEPAPQVAPSPPGGVAAPAPHPGYQVPTGAVWSTPSDATGSRGTRLFHLTRWGLPGRISQVPAEPYDPTTVAPQPGIPYLPGRGASGAPAAVSHPFPGPPPAVTEPCASGDCGSARGSCWERAKAWLCYHPTPYHFPCTPTPFYPRHYTAFLCKEQGLCGPAGCGPHGCAPASGGPVGVVAPAPVPAAVPGYETGGPVTAGGRIGALLAGLKPGRDKSDKTGPPAGWATAGATIPGYRYAIPENRAVLGKAVPVPPPAAHRAYWEPSK